MIKVMGASIAAIALYYLVRPTAATTSPFCHTHLCSALEHATDNRWG